MPPRVSVLLPYRDACPHLAAALASIRAQTFADWELLAIDDHSRDASARLLGAAAARDGRIRLLTNPGRGLADALNHAAAHAEGAFLARMDADDIAHRDRLGRQWALLRAWPALDLCGTAVRVFGPAAAGGRLRYAAWLNRQRWPWQVARARLVECPVAHPTFFMRRAALDRLGGYRAFDGPEDYDLVLRLLARGGRVANCPEPLLHWRDTMQRASRTDPRYRPAAFFQLKRAHLLETFLADGAPCVQWGAGIAGKAWLRTWPADRRPEYVVDVAPRRVGQRVHGVPVVPPAALDPPGSRRIVVAVGVPGARAQLRAWFAPRGYTEGRDYLFVA